MSLADTQFVATRAPNGSTVTAAMKSNGEGLDLRALRVGDGWLPQSTALKINSSYEEMCNFINGMPKAELHMHIDGCIEPEVMLRIAKRNDNMHKLIPSYSNFKDDYQWCAAVRERRRFRDLQDFLNQLYEACDVFCTEEDFYDLGMHYLHAASKENVRHVEIFFDPQTHPFERNNIHFDVIVTGLHRACKDGRTLMPPVSAKLIMCLLRHRSPHCPWPHGRAPADEHLRTVENAIRHKDKILGLGLDSSEAGNPPKRFCAEYAKARAAGLRLVAHAGEEGPAAWVSDALDDLKIERVDHGVRSLEDEKVVARLRESQVPLTVCPLSNHRLQVYSRFMAGENAVRQLLSQGLKVTVNSDDPAYFWGHKDKFGTEHGGYLNANYHCTAVDCGLTADEVVHLAKNSFDAAFISAEERDSFLSELEHYCKTYAGKEHLQKKARYGQS